MPTITDEQIERAFASGNGPRLVMEMRAALEAAQRPAVAVSEDPVRRAARQVLQAHELNYVYRNIVMDALREALAQPAPPSLTEDERKALVKLLNTTLGGVPHYEDDPALKPVLEKLS